MHLDGGETKTCKETWFWSRLDIFSVIDIDGICREQQRDIYQAERFINASCAPINWVALSLSRSEMGLAGLKIVKR